jgi:hypothetical protein
MQQDATLKSKNDMHAVAQQYMPDLRHRNCPEDILNVT